MPRPPETRLRRFMMQGIMWVILGATIGLAALVDSRRAGKRDPGLGEPITLGGGISIRLPAGWKVDEKPEDVQTLVDAIDYSFGRMISLEMEELSLPERLEMSLDRPRGRPQILGEIPLGAAKAPLVLRRIRDEDGEVSEFVAMRILPRGRHLTLTLATAAASNRQELATEESLIKQVAASIKIPGDVEAVPATQTEGAPSQSPQ